METCSACTLASLAKTSSSSDEAMVEKVARLQREEPKRKKREKRGEKLKKEAMCTSAPLQNLANEFQYFDISIFLYFYISYMIDTNVMNLHCRLPHIVFEMTY